MGAPVIVDGAKPASCAIKPVGEVRGCELSGELFVSTVAFSVSAETCSERGRDSKSPPVIVEMIMERMRLCWAAQEVRSALLLFHNCKPINSD